MKRIACSVSFLALSIFHGFLFAADVNEPQTGKAIAAETQAYINKNYSKIPLHFEANAGQRDARVKFLARGQGYNLFLTRTEALLVLNKRVYRKDAGQLAEEETHRHGGIPPAVGNGKNKPIAAAAVEKPSSTDRSKFSSATLRMRLVGANADSAVMGEEELPGKSNYFVGNDSANWHTDIANYRKVRYADIYSGIDLVYYGNQRQLEYDFVVNPGADYKKIRLSFAGTKKISIDRQGNLILHMQNGEVIQHKPVVYQKDDLASGGPDFPAFAANQRAAGSAAEKPETYRELSSIAASNRLAGRYILLADNKVGFAIDNYDPSKTLVIDPLLPLLGGGGDDSAWSIAADSAGAIYVTGGTSSADFPTTGGVKQTALNGASDAFVTKLDSSGSSIIYSTYLGGSSGETAYGIAVDASGNAYFTGGTNSTDFPLAAAIQSKLGGPNNTPQTNPIGDAFVSVLNPAGSQLLFSSYLGGKDWDEGYGIGVDSTRNLWVTGTTVSADWPFTLPSNPLLFKSVFGGVSHAFVAKINAGTSTQPWTLVYSTLLGGSSVDQGNGLAVDSSGNAYVTGNTGSSDFPTTAGAFQTTLRGANNAFVTKFPSTVPSLPGGNPGYSTFLGGSLSDGSYNGGNPIAVDTAGNAYVTGFASSADFPVTQGAYQTENLARRSKLGGLGGMNNIFVTKLNAAGSALVYSTYLGGTATTFDPVSCWTNGTDQDHGHAIAVDGAGNAWVTGGAVTPGAQWVAAGAPWPAPIATAALSSSACANLRKISFASININYGTNAPSWWQGFPITPNALQKNYGGATYDVFVTEFNPTGSAVLYSTFLGGSEGEDMGHGIAVTAAGKVWVTGFTNSPNFPLGRPAAYDAFIIGFQGVPAAQKADDCLFNWAELAYPQFFAPAGAASATYASYYYRFYSGTGNYLAVSSADNHVWVLGPMSGNNLLDVGPITNYLTTAGCSQ